ncbi:hypothetical protein B0H17DRAFT_1205710 [Mycena rosella]|uniref:Uncharacterized protein n=1 Tax=Mycena rosella TaxID=1033263 RepID=A0AAD7G9R7_MYCRO|nr:hypothetical protein B0H17DRAFT_1205710 [Mycena rosella]
MLAVRGSAPRFGSRYTGAIACATLYDVHMLDTRPGAHPSPSPHHQPHAQHATLPFFVIHAAYIASPRTATHFSSVPPSLLEARTCHAPRHHLHDLLCLQRAPWPFPIAGSVFIAFLRAKRVSRPRHMPQPPPTLPLDDLPARRHHFQPLTILRSKPAPVRRREYYVEHHRSTQQLRRAFPVLHAAFITSPRVAPILCADAGLRRTLYRRAHHERDLADRTTMRLGSRDSSARHLGLTAAGL